MEQSNCRLNNVYEYNEEIYEFYAESENNPQLTEYFKSHQGAKATQ